MIFLDIIKCEVNDDDEGWQFTKTTPFDVSGKKSSFTWEVVIKTGACGLCHGDVSVAR